MQLPRGTFREIKKNQKVCDILEELVRTRFSGICNISYKDILCTLVMKSGKCILAKYGAIKGDAAWEELQKIQDRESDAALSNLDEAQIQLSLEFNKAARIIKANRIPPTPQKSTGSYTHTNPSASAHTQPPSPLHPPRVTEGPIPGSATRVTGLPMTPQHKHVPGKDHTGIIPKQVPPTPSPSPTPKKISRDDTNVQNPADTTGIDKDMDVLDTIDIEQVTEKIRDDCKTMIKQLHLEHLMDR